MLLSLLTIYGRISWLCTFPNLMYIIENLFPLNATTRDYILKFRTSDFVAFFMVGNYWKMRKYKTAFMKH